MFFKSSLGGDDRVHRESSSEFQSLAPIFGILKSSYLSRSGMLSSLFLREMEFFLFSGACIYTDLETIVVLICEFSFGSKDQRYTEK